MTQVYSTHQFTRPCLHSGRLNRPVTATVILGTALFVAAGTGSAGADAMRVPRQPTAVNLSNELAQVMSQLPHPQTVASACVIDLRTQTTLFEYNADAALVPASNMKVFAMAVSLVELGPDFKFQTLLAGDGHNLMLVGDGDPGFGDAKLTARRGELTLAVFDRWADTLLRSGHRVIPGDLIYDDFLFADDSIHPSWESEDLGKWYAAPVTALTINDGCLDVSLVPVGQQSPALAVSVIPTNSLATLMNEAKFASNGSPLLHHIPGTRNYRITGATDKAYTFGPVAFPDPAMLCADALKTALQKKGVTIKGSVRRGRVRNPAGFLPLQVRILDIHATPLSDVLNRAGKDSQNLFAECLLKRAGYAWDRRHGASQPVGAWATGASAVVEMLQRAGINGDGLRVADGSGLSRENRCSARQLAALNAWLHRSPYADVYRESLAVAGVDGSLRKRMKSEDGRVRGKTGTMRGIRTLSGYVDDDSGPRYAFAVMFNNYPGTSGPYKDIQDKICSLLVGSAIGSN